MHLIAEDHPSGVLLFTVFYYILCNFLIFQYEYILFSILSLSFSQIPVYTAGTHGDYKMVLVVRQDLGMGKGKIAAQVRELLVNLDNNYGKHRVTHSFGPTLFE